MKRILLGAKDNYYKANLHCHTTLSDGRKTPEEIKELFKSQGYSVVAFTDHDVLVPHPELKDEDFLPLNGMEFSIRNKCMYRDGKDPCVHLCFIALEEVNVQTPLYHRTKYVTKEESRSLITYDESLPDYERWYHVGRVNEIIHAARELGFFVTYNHPVWSFEGADRLLQYQELDGLEIYNHSACIIGYDEYNTALLDHLNRAGKGILPIAADDNHNKYPLGHKRCDACGGFVMINAERLEYRTITAALQKGDFYASNGAVIHSVSVEDGILTVTGENMERVNVVWEYGGYKTAVSEEEALTEAVLEMPKERGWFRVQVYDRNGKFASTRAFLPEEYK